MTKRKSDRFRIAFSQLDKVLTLLEELKELSADAQEACDAVAVGKEQLTDAKVAIAAEPIDDAYEVVNDLHSYFMRLEDAKTDKAALRVARPAYCIQ